MPIEYDAAISEMAKLFKAAWLVNSGAVFGYVPAVEWYGIEDKEKIDRSKVWVAFTTQSVIEEQGSLSTCVDQADTRMYDAAGLVIIQLFLPKSVDNAVFLGRQLAKVARNAFRGKKTDGGIVFYNVRINNVDPEDQFYRFNVVAEYEYSELG